MRRLVLAAAVSAAVLAAPARASGTEMLSAWLVLDPGPVGGIGVGARYMLPLADGVIRHPRVRDEFVLELGVDFAHYGDRVGAPPNVVDYSWNGLLLAAGLSWNFWLTPRFALYPKLDLGVWFGSYRGWDDTYGYRRADHGGPYVEPAIGLIFRLGRADLRLELGSDLTRVGLGFEY